MKLIICFRHLKCIFRKWCRGMDYSWHVQHLLREFGCGPLADFRSVSDLKETSREATVSVRVTSDLPAFIWQRVQGEASAVFGGGVPSVKAEWMEGDKIQQSVAPVSRCP
jgi:hypothetical protein